jgi:hypothetical protein
MRVCGCGALGTAATLASVLLLCGLGSGAGVAGALSGSKVKGDKDLASEALDASPVTPSSSCQHRRLMRLTKTHPPEAFPCSSTPRPGRAQTHRLRPSLDLQDGCLLAPSPLTPQLPADPSAVEDRGADSGTDTLQGTQCVRL